MQYPPNGFPGAPAPQFAQPGAPAPWAQAPAPQFAQPPQGYGAPAPAPAPVPQVAPPGYGAPAPAPQGYGAPPPAWGAPAPQAPPAWQQAAQAAPAPQGGRWEGVADSTVFTKSPFYPENFSGIIRLDEVKATISKNPKNLGSLFVVVETEVLSSNLPAVPANTKRGQVINMNKFGNADLKAVIGAAVGLRAEQFETAKQCQPRDLDQIFQQAPGTFDALFAQAAAQNPRAVVGGLFAPVVLDFVTGPANPLRGRVMALTTAMNGKGTFTKHNWSPYTAAT